MKLATIVKYLKKYILKVPTTRSDASSIFRMINEHFTIVRQASKKLHFNS